MKNKFKQWLLKKIGQKNYITSFDENNVKKILLIREGGIGDAICNYSLIKELNRKYPNVEIDVFAGKNNYMMYKYNPYVKNVFIKYKKVKFYKTWIDIIKMRLNNYDVCIDNTIIRFHRTLYSRIINPKYIFASKGKKEHYGFDRSELSLYYKIYEDSKIEHIINSRLKVLEFFKIDSYSSDFEFFLPSPVNSINEQFIKNINSNKNIGLNLEGGDKRRKLSDEQFINISNIFKQENSVKLVLFTLPLNRDYYKRLIRDNKLYNIVLSPITNSIYDVADLINRVDLLITPDTSLVHIASGLNVPTLGIFWDYEEKYIEWGPLSIKHDIVKSKDKEKNIKNIDINEIFIKSLKLL